jgi:hypothetical protein
VGLKVVKVGEPRPAADFPIRHPRTGIHSKIDQEKQIKEYTLELEIFEGNSGQKPAEKP